MLLTGPPGTSHLEQELFPFVAGPGGEALGQRFLEGRTILDAGGGGGEAGIFIHALQRVHFSGHHPQGLHREFWLAQCTCTYLPSEHA